MCIAILNTAGTIKQKTFKHCWDNNPDGGGIAYPKDGKIKIIKEMKSYNEFYKQYKTVREENPKVNILIHFRIATHGKINETNCHPFLVNKSLGFIHNGMIYGKGLSVSNEFSDTYLFNQTILKTLPQNFLKNEAILKLLEEYIGYSKIVFLDGKNNWAILNEESGHWNGNNWFSNDSYKEKVKPVYSDVLKYNNKDYFNYGSNNFWKDDGIDRKYNPKEKYCQCCDESCKDTKFIAEFNIDMCPKCIEAYVYKPLDD